MVCKTMYTGSNPVRASIFLLSGILGASSVQLAAVAETIPIASARIDADGDFIPDLLGQAVQIEAVVKMPSGRLEAEHLLIGVQDDSGAIQVFEQTSAKQIKLGQRVRVHGTVHQHKGATQLHRPEIEILGQSPVLPAVELPLSEIGEATEGALVTVQGEVMHIAENAGGDRYALHGGGQMIHIFQHYGHPEPPMADVLVGDTVTVTGTVGQWDPTKPYNSGYQVSPRFPADVIRVANPIRIYGALLKILLAAFVILLPWGLILRRKLREQGHRAAHSERQFETVFERNSDGLVITDPKSQILASNPAARTILGLTDSPQDIALLEDMLKESDDGVRAVRTGCYLDISDRELDARDGKRLMVIRDETQRFEAEQDLIAANNKLQEALADLRTAKGQQVQRERLAALGEMASGIAHDFNNALQAVIGYTEVLLDEVGEKQKQHCRAILSAAGNAAGVVSRLRDFYRHRSDHDRFGSVDLASVARRTIRLTEPKWGAQSQAAGSQIRMIERIQDVPMVIANENDLIQVLTNLIFNSVDAMPEGGTLTVEVSPENDAVLLAVRDTGQGMDERTRKRCLEPFYSTKGQDGTGLGLAIAYGAIERHDADLQIESSPGKGTSIEIRIPSNSKGKQTVQPAPALASGHSYKVLVVDDAVAVLTVIEALLSAMGHKVSAYCSPTEALKAFHTETFDLVITDRSMPEMSGDQLAELVKKKGNIPVLLLSGFSGMIAPDECPPGIDRLVPKPIRRDALAAAIESAMQQAPSDFQDED